MVIDMPAPVTNLADEPEQAAFIDAIEHANVRLVFAAVRVEASVVLEVRYGAAGVHDLDRLFERAGIEIASLDEEQAHLARSTFQRFGKGCHPVGLNFGNCDSYALTVARGEPLLSKSNDFPQAGVPQELRS